ncbi:MAG: hypothetical protein IJW78_03800 [Clostridia bacterium]|nr:hypothetical protein [Clostridia bacterium]
MLKAVLTRFLVSVLLPLLAFLVPGKAATPTTEVPVDYAALLNMNYCYGTSFSDSDIATGTLLSLLDLAEEDADGRLFLPVEQADLFSGALYGKTVDYAQNGLQVEDGRIEIPAMGYSLYNHTLISTEEDGDRVKVVSKVVCEGHEGESFDALCNSIFVKNADSAFGYHLVSSEILA